MARGKYASKADSAKARESALAEAAKLRRENERLHQEVESLRGDLNDTLAALHSETTRLRLIIAAGETEATETLHAELRDLAGQLASVRGDLGREIRDLASQHVVRAPKEFWRTLAELTGVDTPDYYQIEDGNRHQRRLTPAKIRKIHASIDSAEAQGVKLL